MLTSKIEAIALGRTVYFDGLPCKRGHLSTRYVSSDGCLQCSQGNVHWAQVTFPVGTDHGLMHYVIFEKLAAHMREWLQEGRIAIRELQGTAQSTMADIQAGLVAARRAKAVRKAAIRAGEISVRMLPHATHTKEWYYDNGWKPENIVSAGFGEWVYSKTGKPVTD